MPSPRQVTSLLALFVIFQSFGLHACHAETEHVILVCPPDFTNAMQPWITQRKREGLSITTIQPPASGQELKTAIKKIASDETRSILLVGDAPVIGQTTDSSCQTPILYARTTVTAKWGSTPTLSSDMLYGDFDGDLIPEAAVGRLPVDRVSQLKTWISRIFARETSNDFGPWRSRVQVVGGVGGFGMIADTAIESVTRSIVTGMLPTDTRTHIYYASPGHHFCPDHKSFTRAVLDNYSEGARFWVYAGHGQVTELDRVAPSLGGKAVLDQESVNQLASAPAKAPIAVILACFTGACDASEDSIAEKMVLNGRGPVAVFAGSRITMPYGNTTAAVGLINGVFHQKLPRLGDAWLSALREMQMEQTDPNATGRMLIDALATLISPTGTKLPEERREHMLLYNLLGDPTLKLQHPLPLDLQRTTNKNDPDSMQLTLASPISGNLVITVDRPLGGVTNGDANNTLVMQTETTAVAGQVQKLDLKLAPEIEGPVVVRAMVSGDDAWASAAFKTILH
ncbi:MAG: peptidase C25 [Rhodopirellula sp.]|nr:peptidase C25 [Rhodopirellula sp.]